MEVPIFLDVSGPKARLHLKIWSNFLALFPPFKYSGGRNKPPSGFRQSGRLHGKRRSGTLSDY